MAVFVESWDGRRSTCLHAIWDDVDLAKRDAVARSRRDRDHVYRIYVGDERPYSWTAMNGVLGDRDGNPVAA